MASNNYEDAKHYFEKSIEKYDNPLSHEEIGIIFFRENKIKKTKLSSRLFKILLRFRID